MAGEEDNVVIFGQHSNVTRINMRAKKEALRCNGVARDKDDKCELRFHFNRWVTDNEMRYLHEVMQRAAACMPEDIEVRQ
jgi:hypothetical protein